ncbi:MAG: hypothetical protein HOU81_01095 [Hamadaea sp.]|uniref:hypothetical protein n=1 Tax=Hamadaea sp. TaxID=2024425 RepID=UPI0018379CA7|nr:hypothetical protein [Hamadaea sp.]NUR69394.1 hypothetical protein [Hamadaea sp.]NUT23211.1 hypothetical protein [Hamadaea sp.]
MYREGRDRWRLRESTFGDRARQRQAALAELTEAGGRAYRAPEREDAGDDSGIVRVTVDRSGAVVDVHIRSDWRDRIGVGGLGPALLAARENAAGAMARALVLGRLAEQERAASEGREPSRDRRPGAYAERSTIDQVWQRLSDNEDHAYRRQKAARAAAERQPRAIGGPLGLLSGRCEGGRLVGITAEPTRTRQADTEQLRHAALDLFRQAEAAEELIA